MRLSMSASVRYTDFYKAASPLGPVRQPDFWRIFGGFLDQEF
jgi:hypothetical protein